MARGMKQLDSQEVLKTFGLAYFRELATFGALSDKAIEWMLQQGLIERVDAGRRITRFGDAANSFHIVLDGQTAFYKRHGDRDVLTRYFEMGDQIGFDIMIGLIPHNGTDVAVRESVILTIGIDQFREFQEQLPADFGLLMINLARELSREIALLEDVIVQQDSTVIDTSSDPAAE